MPSFTAVRYPGGFRQLDGGMPTSKAEGFPLSRHTMQHSPKNVSPSESADIIDDSLTPPEKALAVVAASAGYRATGTPFRASSNRSRSNSVVTVTASLLSTADSDFEARNTDVFRRPTMMSRLKSSISTFSTSTSGPRRPSTSPSDFAKPPESPERHFIDSVGMVIPGVCNRSQCSHPLSHFVINWRLCEPIEYSTALADHRLTYSDYCRLIAALANFLDGLPKEEKRKTKAKRKFSRESLQDAYGTKDNGYFDSQALQKNSTRHGLETPEQYNRTRQHAHCLNELLAEITYNWRSRGVPVMVCIGSYSLFAPNRISEAHVQILHVPFLIPDNQSSISVATTEVTEQPSFGHGQENQNVSLPRRKLSDDPFPQRPTRLSFGAVVPGNKLHADRNRPWPLWPNAIPTTKRALINSHVGRYGTDPFFRAYLRANINSRTTSASYAKYMIERENDPFINKRLEYVSPASKKIMRQGRCLEGEQNRQKKKPALVNRSRYEHNRRLECRKSVELGSRLRIVRFGFRNPIYPPHTPEMDELGLYNDKYEQILSEIEDIRSDYSQMNCAPCPFRCAFRGRRSAKDALTKASEYVRTLNAQQGKIIWTIEKIPSVYDGIFGAGKEEWEVSAWNAEDPLELLLQLEKWGIIEKRLDIDDEEY